jgi:SAM-dependent methyltransferase
MDVLKHNREAWDGQVAAGNRWTVPVGPEVIARARQGDWSTVLDASPAQLAQDRLVAAREGLEIETVLGDMADLRAFPGSSFDLVVNPVSTCFVPDVRRVWREAARVLRPGGVLVAGFVNPVLFTVDADLQAKGELRLRHRIPYSDLTSIGPEERARLVPTGTPLEFGHSLGDLLGGQLDAGLVLAGFYEDGRPDGGPIEQLLPCFLATRAVK